MWNIRNWDRPFMWCGTLLLLLGTAVLLGGAFGRLMVTHADAVVGGVMIVYGLLALNLAAANPREGPEHISKLPQWLEANPQSTVKPDEPPPADVWFKPTPLTGFLASHGQIAVNSLRRLGVTDPVLVQLAAEIQWQLDRADGQLSFDAFYTDNLDQKEQSNESP